MAKGAIVMQESKTHFEQIPVAVVKKIAEEVHDGIAGNDNAAPRTSPSKLKPHRLASLRRQRKASLTMQFPKPEINCSICDKPVALETAKTDEVGQAAHEECYLFKLGIKAGHNSVQASKPLSCGGVIPAQN
jgi:hypothetical protein